MNASCTFASHGFNILAVMFTSKSTKLSQAMGITFEHKKQAKLNVATSGIVTRAHRVKLYKVTPTAHTSY